MLVVYGRRGAAISIGALLLNLITMYAVSQGVEVVELFITVGAGLLIYALLSVTLAYVLHRWEQAQSLSMALYATAKYLRCRSDMLKPTTSFDEAARQTVKAQATMVDVHQLARDMLYSQRDTRTSEPRARHQDLAQVLYLTVNVHDMLLGTYHDDKLLRQTAGTHDILVSSAAILSTLADQLDWIALAVGNHKPARKHGSIDAQLHELEQAIIRFKQDGQLGSNQAVVIVLQQLHHRLVSGKRPCSAHDRSDQTVRPPPPARRACQRRCGASIC